MIEPYLLGSMVDTFYSAILYAFYGPVVRPWGRAFGMVVGKPAVTFIHLLLRNRFQYQGNPP